MIYLRLLVSLAAMPFLVKAEMFRFFACGNFMDVLDSMGLTQAGAVQLSNFFQQDPTVMLWNPNTREQDHMCLKLMFTPAGMFEHKYFNKTGGLVTLEGNMTYSTYPTATFQLTATDPANNDPATSKRLPLGTLSANRDGVANMFPLYISATEVIVLSCLNTFFGHLMSAYVLTTQDLSILDIACAISTLKEVTGITFKSAGNMTACMEMHSAGR